MSVAIKSGKFDKPKAISFDDGKFLFISYSHRNALLVSTDLAILKDYELPFWYDDGMQAGKSWEERAWMAMSHPNCVGVLFVITKSSLTSKAVFTELNMATKLSVEREDFSIFSLNVGGKTVSDMILSVDVPNEVSSLYRSVFPDNDIFVSRSTRRQSTEHIPYLLEIFNELNLLKHKYKAVLERSPFVLEPYKNGYSIISYRGTAENVIIPQCVGNKKIIAVGQSAFKNLMFIKKVDMLGDVFDIFDNAFEGCISLKSIQLSGALQYVGNESFKGCKRLSAVSFPDNLKAIGDYSFYECRGLKEVDFNNAKVSIGYSAFSQCVKLEKIVLSKNTVEIGDYAFGACAIRNVTLYDAVSKLGEDCFTCNPNLKNITYVGHKLPQSLPNRLISLCPNFEAITLPFEMPIEEVKRMSLYQNTVRKLSEVSGFSNDTNGFIWRKIEGADYYVLTVGEERFETMQTFIPYKFKRKKYRISFEAISESKGVNNSVSYFVYNVKLPIVEGRVLKGGDFFEGKIHCSESVERIENGAFKNNISVSSLAFNGTEIGDSAFETAGNLEKVTLGKETVLGNAAFRFCTKLNAINMENVVSMGAGAFECCYKLADFKFNDKIKVIPGRAFRRCVSVKRFNLPSGLRVLQKECLRGCMGVTELNIPNSVETIEAKALTYLSLKKITLPSSLVSYDVSNLQSCSYLEKISIENNDSFKINAIGALVKNGDTLVRFPPAKKQKSLVLGDEIKYISSGAFADTSFIESVKMEGVEEIGDCAFYSSSSLKEVWLPASLKKIGANAFANVLGLEKVYIKGDGFVSILPTSFPEGIKIIVSKKKAETLNTVEWKNSKEIVIDEL